jgi:pyridoxal 5'-phosphate synthase pdxT subunit
VSGAVGVLALQGDFAAHARILRATPAVVREVRRCTDLDGLAALVLPGGESTAVLRLMAGEPWLDALHAFHARGGALLGTCAGIILLARAVDPPQPSAGLLDVSVARNAYGRQADSFEAPVLATGLAPPFPGVFIRAPRILGVGPGVEVLARVGEAPVAVRQGRVMGITFHPELTGDERVHRRFLEIAA